MYRWITTLVAVLAVSAGCAATPPAGHLDDPSPAAQEGSDASFAEALELTVDGLLIAHTAIAFAHRAANREALLAVGADPRAREAAVLGVYERFFPIWRTYATARGAYVAAVAEARDAAARGRRLKALVALARAGDDLATAVAEARAIAAGSGGAR